MAVVRWIKTSLLLGLVLRFPVAAGTPPSYFTVSVGDEVTLQCGTRTDHQLDFGSTEWLFTGLRAARSQILVKKLSREVVARSDRLSVTANLSLVINTVTVEDVGFYTCRQNVSGEQDDADYFLSVIDMSQQRTDDKVVWTCSVLQYEDCRHEVEWSYQHKEETLSDVEISPPSCSATVTFPTSELLQKYYESLTCKVTNTYTGKIQFFHFNPPPLLRNPDPVMKASSEQQDFPYFLRGIIVSVGLAVLIVSVVMVNIWIKCKGNKSQMNEDTRLNDKEDDKNVQLYENIV